MALRQKWPEAASLPRRPGASLRIGYFTIGSGSAILFRMSLIALFRTG